VKPARPRILIADDEPLLRAELRDALAELWPEADIAGEAANGIQALRMGQQLSPDVAFLDIRMPGLSGLEVARTFGPHTRVVFITAHQDHAVAAFDDGAVDYVLKPFEPERLGRSIERVRARLGAAPADAPPPAPVAKPAASPWLQASIGNAIHFIHLSEVVYFCSDFKYTRVVTDAQVAHIRTPIKDLADTLDDSEFWQIHRGYMVAVKRIAAVTREEDGAMWLTLRQHDARLPVSQRFQHRFKGS
jgi:DNA-binding LytR/AlgR family response regulator